MFFICKERSKKNQLFPLDNGKWNERKQRLVKQRRPKISVFQCQWSPEVWCVVWFLLSKHLWLEFCNLDGAGLPFQSFVIVQIKPKSITIKIQRSCLLNVVVLGVGGGWVGGVLLGLTSLKVVAPLLSTSWRARRYRLQHIHCKSLWNAFVEMNLSLQRSYWKAELHQR